MGCACGGQADITVTYHDKEFRVGNHTGGIKPLLAKINKEFEELSWVHWKLITKKGNENITKTEQLRTALMRSKNKLDLEVEIQKDMIPGQDLKTLSYAVVKLVSQNVVRGTGILIGERYVMTTYCGKGKLNDAADLDDYKIVTRESTSKQKWKHSKVFKPKPSGVWIYMPERSFCLFELTENVENRGIMLSGQSLESHNLNNLTGAIMYYKSKSPALKCDQNTKVAMFDDKNYVHAGKFKGGDGSEGAPMFLKYPGEEEWHLGCIRYQNESPPQGDDCPNTAIKSSWIIEELSKFDQTSRNQKHKRVIQEIIVQPALPSTRLSATTNLAQDPKPAEPKPKPAAVERPPERHPTPPKDWSHEKKAGYIHGNGIVEYETGTHTKWNTSTSTSYHEGQCVTITPIGMIITGGSDHNNALVWNGKSVSNDDIPNMKYEHQHHCAILFGDELFVIGGSHTDKVEAFDIKNHQWNPRGELITQRSNATATIYDNSIIVIGGIDARGNYLDTIEQFKDNTWQEINVVNLPVSIAFAGAIPLKDDKIILFGGKTENESKGERKNTYHLNFSKGTVKEGKKLEIGGYFSYYQPTRHGDEAVTFNDEGELTKYSFPNKKFYRLCVGAADK